MLVGGRYFSSSEVHVMVKQDGSCLSNGLFLLNLLEWVRVSAAVSDITVKINGLLSCV